MKKLVLAALASAAISLPALAQQQQPQQQPMQSQQAQPSTQQMSQQQMSPRDLSRQQIRQIQDALNQKGFNAGKADGTWGPKTRSALEDFQKSKGIQANGRLDNQTLSDLGLNSSQFMNQSGNMNGQGNMTRSNASSVYQPNQNNATGTKGSSSTNP